MGEVSKSCLFFLDHAQQTPGHFCFSLFKAWVYRGRGIYLVSVLHSVYHDCLGSATIIAFNPVMDAEETGKFTRLKVIKFSKLQALLPVPEATA